jgi:hypothetical protein
MRLPDDAKVIACGEGHGVQIDGRKVHPRLPRPRSMPSIDIASTVSKKKNGICQHHLLLRIIEALLENERDLRCSAHGVVRRQRRGERRGGKGWE